MTPDIPGLAGPDGNLWFTEYRARKIGRITTAGVFTEFTIPTPSGSTVTMITAGPDGNLWFSTTNNICNITTAGVITVFPVLGSPATPVVPDGIATGSDGNIWFTEFSGNKVVRMAP